MPAKLLKNTALNRISTVVDQVFKESEIFNEEVDKAQFMQHFSDRIENGLAPRELIAITEEELTQWIKQYMAIDVLSGLLS
ncbi:MAG: hypothetical protein ACE1ZS_01080, partial [Candidatus Poribacteria bacterium]